MLSLRVLASIRSAAPEVVEGDQADGLVTFDDPETLSGFTVEVTVADPASGLLLGNDSRDVERPGLTGQEADQGISVVGDETPEGEIHGPESYGSSGQAETDYPNSPWAIS